MSQEDNRTLQCGCKAYTNTFGEIKIYEWNCSTHIENKEWIIQAMRDEGFHGMREVA